MIDPDAIRHVIDVPDEVLNREILSTKPTHRRPAGAANYTSSRSNAIDYFVLHISWILNYPGYPGMRNDHRLLALFNRIECGATTGVSNVNRTAKQVYQVQSAAEGGLNPPRLPSGPNLDCQCS
jgi:hypothetical protein